MKAILTKSPVQPILKKLKSYLQNEYKNNLVQVVLFGSQAREDARLDSDIDILIILKNDFDYYQEIKQISPFVSDLCLEYNQLITCCFTTLKQWQTENSAFYRNICKEGIIA